MRVYTPSGDLAVRTFTFPDGQPHISLETHEIDFHSATVETALRNPAELFQLGLVVDVLRDSGYTEINVDIRYLLAARMDRAISSNEPFTLRAVARFLNSLGLTRVRILDVHSEVATRLIRHSVNVLPHAALNQALHTLGPVSVVVPDKGAVDRVEALCPHYSLIRCSKVREMATGKLSGFAVDSGHQLRGGGVCIVDDICDGGGTFVGLAAELRKAGATGVSLFVTHGIFSRGLPLEGIDRVFTTDSYLCSNEHPQLSFTRYEGATVIPVSMKEMK